MHQILPEHQQEDTFFSTKQQRIDLWLLISKSLGFIMNIECLDSVIGKASPKVMYYPTFVRSDLDV